MGLSGVGGGGGGGFAASHIILASPYFEIPGNGNDVPVVWTGGTATVVGTALALGTPEYLVVASEAGLYMASARLVGIVAASVYARAALVTNGTALVPDGSRVASGTAEIIVYGIARLTAGQVWALQVKQEALANVTLAAARMSIHRIG